MLGLLGKKKGMTQVFNDEGDLVPVTVIQVGPCTVVQHKTRERDGYEALQLGFETRKAEKLTKPKRGHFAKRGTDAFRYLREFSTTGAADIPVGSQVTAAAFHVGDVVHVRGITKGRGFQGVIKRHGKHGGPAAHGSDFHRRPGSIGMRTWPGRVLKNMGMPGHMGDEKVMVRNLEVVAVLPEEHAVLIRGTVPGTREGVVEVVSANNDFSARIGKQAKPTE